MPHSSRGRGDGQAAVLQGGQQKRGQKRSVPCCSSAASSCSPVPTSARWHPHPGLWQGHGSLCGAAWLRPTPALAEGETDPRFQRTQTLAARVASGSVAIAGTSVSKPEEEEEEGASFFPFSPASPCCESPGSAAVRGCTSRRMRKRTGSKRARARGSVRRCQHLPVHVRARSRLSARRLSVGGSNTA